MCRNAARRLARYFRSIGIPCVVRRNRLPNGKTVWRVERTA